MGSVVVVLLPATCFALQLPTTFSGAEVNDLLSKLRSSPGNVDICGALDFYKNFPTAHMAAIKLFTIVFNNITYLNNW
jgi:hypothetical protein